MHAWYFSKGKDANSNSEIEENTIDANKENRVVHARLDGAYGTFL